jgi:Polyketide cyclase / dehydrase and lipid transport
MRVLRFLGWLSVVIVLAILTAIFMGSRVPEAHTVSVSETVPASQEKVWGLITDVGSQPNWRTGLKSVSPLPSENGAPCWAEVESGMTMPLCADVREAPGRQVVRVADPKLPFGGSWTYVLEPAGENATKVTITENGTTGPAMWRFVDHYILHEDGEIRTYLADLKRVTSQGTPVSR